MKSGKGAAKVSKDALKPATDDRKIGKRKAVVAVSDKSNQRKARQEKKAKKDPNKPKRPPSAFFVFLEDFRKTFKKENPNVSSVAAVGKAGGAKWKSLSPAEKAPYDAKAAKKKDEYGKLMNAYNKKDLMNGNEGSVKTKPAVHDEDDEADDEEEQDEEDDEVEEEEEEEDDD